MVEYYIEAIDQQGRSQSLTLTAKNSTMADELVRSQGLQPTLIKHANTHIREQRDAVASQKRRRLFSVAGIGLMLLVLAGGAGTWLYIQNLQSNRGFTLDAVRIAAADADAAGNTTGATEELAAFASDLFGAMHLKYPGLVRSVNVKSPSLLFVHLNPHEATDTTTKLHLLTRVMVQSLQTAQGSDHVSVFMIENGVTVADARYANGETTVNVHVNR